MATAAKAGAGKAVKARKTTTSAQALEVKKGSKASRTSRISKAGTPANTTAVGQARPAAAKSRAVAAKPGKSPAKAPAKKASPRPSKPAAKTSPGKGANSRSASENAPVASSAASAASAVNSKAKPDRNGKSREKGRKVRVVRDSFTMPETEYAVLAAVKKRCLAAGFQVKKSELLRIGVAMIRALETDSLKNWIDSLPPLKPGRPPKEKMA